MRTEEMYAFQCWQCGVELELPAASGACVCPQCGAAFDIGWRDEKTHDSL